MTPALGLAAADPADNEMVQKFVPVKNMAGTDRLQRLVNLLSVYEVSVRGDNVLKVITLRGKRSAVAEAEKVIAQFDVAPRNTIEVIAYLLGASEDPARAGTVPRGLEPVTKELARVFGYKSFALRESAILRASEGASAGASGFLPLAVQANYPRVYRLGFDQAEVITEAKGRSIRLSRLFFQTEIFSTSDKGGTQPLRISADSLDLGEGQSVVFGKSNVHESGDVVVVVLTARVVN
jgi:hypothetical protein